MRSNKVITKMEMLDPLSCLLSYLYQPLEKIVFFCVCFQHIAKHKLPRAT